MVGYDLSFLTGLLIHAGQFEGVDFAGRGMDFGARGLHVSADQKKPVTNDAGCESVPADGH